MDNNELVLPRVLGDPLPLGNIADVLIGEDIELLLINPEDEPLLVILETDDDLDLSLVEESLIVNFSRTLSIDSPLDVVEGVLSVDFDCGSGAGLLLFVGVAGPGGAVTGAGATIVSPFGLNSGTDW